MLTMVDSTDTLEVDLLKFWGNNERQYSIVFIIDRDVLTHFFPQQREKITNGFWPSDGFEDRFGVCENDEKIIFFYIFLLFNYYG